MLRRLHHTQPDSFAFTKDNLAWTETQTAKYPDDRRASAIIPILWRAQEQEGWLSKPALETVADMLGMDYIRVLEVASFYFMFQLQPTGAIAHIQVCGTTTCMICGAEDLIGICREVIAPNPHEISKDGNFTWEEVECLGACTNAPMAQVGKDYYEDLTADKFRAILSDLAAGNVPTPGPQNGRYAAEPLAGLTSLKEFESGRDQHNASVARAVSLGDTVKRIQGDEVPILKPKSAAKAKAKPAPAAKPAKEKPAKASAPAETGTKPEKLDGPRDGKADNLKKIKGIGPKLESLLNGLGFYHFDQIAAWSEAEVAWVDDAIIGFKGRVSRDGWVEQAKKLAAGEDTEFSKRVAKGDVY